MCAWMWVPFFPPIWKSSSTAVSITVIPLLFVEDADKPPHVELHQMLFLTVLWWEDAMQTEVHNTTSNLGACFLNITYTLWFCIQGHNMFTVKKA